MSKSHPCLQLVLLTIIIAFTGKILRPLIPEKTGNITGIGLCRLAERLLEWCLYQLLSKNIRKDTIFWWVEIPYEVGDWMDSVIGFYLWVRDHSKKKEEPTPCKLPYTSCETKHFPADCGEILLTYLSSLKAIPLLVIAWLLLSLFTIKNEDR